VVLLALLSLEEDKGRGADDKFSESTVALRLLLPLSFLEEPTTESAAAEDDTVVNAEDEVLYCVDRVEDGFFVCGTVDKEFPDAERTGWTEAL